MIYVSSEGEFDKILKDNEKVVICFTASWCGPCKKVAPKYESLSTQFSDIVFLKVDVDELADLAQKYDVSAMPTYIFMKSGKKVGEVIGAKIDDVEKMIKK